jgi:hypothetical protein
MVSYIPGCLFHGAVSVRASHYIAYTWHHSSWCCWRNSILHQSQPLQAQGVRGEWMAKLTPWSWALLERSLVVRTLDSFPAFYGTRRFSTEFTRALHLSLSWARPIQSTSPHPTSRRSILILSIHLRLGLPSGLFPSGIIQLYDPMELSNTREIPGC